MSDNKNYVASEEVAAFARSFQEQVLDWRASGHPTAQPQPMGGTRVCARLRPLIGDEQTGVESHRALVSTAEFEVASVVAPDQMYLHEPALAVGELTGDLIHKQYHLHRAFGCETPDAAVTDEIVGSLVDECLSGGTGFAVAYGQTGSGKTYTQQRVQLEAACRLLNRDSDGAGLTISFFENCGDENYDLLADGSGEEYRDCSLPIRDDGTGRMVVADLREVHIDSVEALHAVFDAAAGRRRTEATSMNEHSSRSHAVCCLGIAGSAGSIRVVDLAGSERKEDMINHSIERVNESKEINWSLSCLKQCIQVNLQNARGGKAARVPYRNSKLTMLLKGAHDLALPTTMLTLLADCFENPDADKAANSMAVFIAHVAPLTSQLGHTKNTLQYAMEMVQLSQLEKQKKAFVGPEQWSKAKFNGWVKQLDGGKFAELAQLKYSGKLFAVEHWNDFEKNILAMGGSATDATAIYEAFHALNKKSKAAARAAKKAAANAPAAAPAEDVAVYRVQMEELYREHNPSKLSDGSIDKLLKSFQGREDELIQKMRQKYGMA